MVNTKSDLKKEKKVEQPNLAIALLDLTGKELKQIELDKQIFDVKVNKALIAQYMRVYHANQRQGNASTKFRSEVIGSTKKIYRQKGTGNARHGARKAPIFVGGGVQGGPKPKDFGLKLNKKQKKQALLATLSLRAKEGAITGLDNAAFDMKPKTKDIVSFMSKAGLANKKTLFILPEIKKNGFVLSTRNIDKVELIPVTTINPYILFTHKQIVFTEEALNKLKDHFLTNEN